MGKLSILPFHSQTSKNYFVFQETKHSGFFQLEIYLNIAYYTCFIPFRIELSKTNQRYEVVQSGIQKILCIICHSLYTIYALLCHGSIIMSTKTMSGSKDSNPLKFFAKLESFIDLTYCFVAVYTVFSKLNKLHSLLDIVQDKHKISQINWKVETNRQTTNQYI